MENVNWAKRQFVSLGHLWSVR